MISLYKLENNLQMLSLEYKFEVNDDELQVYTIVGDLFRINIDVKDKHCLIRTEQGDKEYKSTKGIINELWRIFK